MEANWSEKCWTSVDKLGWFQMFKRILKLWNGTNGIVFKTDTFPYRHSLVLTPIDIALNKRIQYYCLYWIQKHMAKTIAVYNVFTMGKFNDISVFPTYVDIIPPSTPLTTYTTELKPLCYVLNECWFHMFNRTQYIRWCFSLN